MNRSPTDRGERGAMGPPPAVTAAAAAGVGLARYGSDPGSLLAGGASEGMTSRFAPPGGDSSPCLTSEPSCWSSDGGPGGSYGLAELHGAADLAAKVGGGGGPALVRHSSSPAGLFTHLLVDHGLHAAREIGSYSQAGTDSVHEMESRRLRSQWSFSRKDALSQISKMSIPELGENVNCGSSSDEAAGHVGQSFISSNFQLTSWDDNNSIMFSAPSKWPKNINGDILASFINIDSQFNLPNTSLEISSVDKYLQLQQDPVCCKVRAKRGCATHPRSIAERERRTRISKRLQKLQGLVPHMDKQTSTSDMLELAIKYIKELQSQVQKLKQEQAACTCTTKQEEA